MEEDERRLRTPTPREGDPSGVPGGLAAPVRHHQQATGDGEGDDAQDDEEERGDPLWGQLGVDAGPVSAVDGLALPDQTHSHRAWIETERETRHSSSNKSLSFWIHKKKIQFHCCLFGHWFLHFSEQVVYSGCTVQKTAANSS